ncbi:hypothetical protein [Cupriavidus pauculus]|uniref:hypothetical protein n=1 Tax=Cupriavidus pauculus TaxID=82633 RepID=UPI001EE2C1C8|nr:hypothetical protein [Cupriavidus pauculus]
MLPFTCQRSSPNPSRVDVPGAVGVPIAMVDCTPMGITVVSVRGRPVMAWPGVPRSSATTTDSPLAASIR